MEYTVEISGDGAVKGLYYGDEYNWINPDSESFGIPFVLGNQTGETNLDCYIESRSKREVRVFSASSKTELTYRLEDNTLELSAKIPLICGPRSGIQLPFHFLDLNTGYNWKHQIMPHVLYTDQDFNYAYFIFRRGDGKHLVMIVDSPFAAWRLIYSEQGHRILGMQLLATADDLILPGNNRPVAAERISCKLSFASDLDSALAIVRKQLGLAVVSFKISGGTVGSHIPLKINDLVSKVVIITPGEKRLPIILSDESFELILEEAGTYLVESQGESGRIHRSRLICYKGWKDLFERITRFSRDHFLHESGACYRVIWQKTLSPEGGRTYEGVAFGAPEEQMSCRTGEFGGFAAWAMIKGLLLYGTDLENRKAVDRYIKNWALNIDYPEKALPGTVFRRSNTFLGRKYGPFHLYEERNYPQYEIFLMEELVDYLELTGDQTILCDLINITNHFIEEHIDEEGCVLCQNTIDGKSVDYTTVHTPLIGLIKVWRLLVFHDIEFAEKIKDVCLKMADYLVDRGFNFPTEGEPCTEDGSMACSAGSLLYAFLYLEQNQEYKILGEKLIEAHELLSLEGDDCRMKGSSLRFWETQYESFDWGPSINAGHSWTLWAGEALILLALINRDYSALEKAWNGFMTNVCKVEESGAMTCSYTPDMIPGTPHYPWQPESQSRAPDLIPSRTELAMGYQRRCYSASGNYFLIKGAEYWDHIGGVDLTTGSTINGIMKEGVYHSDAAKLKTLFVKGKGDIRIHNPEEGEIEIYRT